MEALPSLPGCPACSDTEGPPSAPYFCQNRQASSEGSNQQERKRLAGERSTFGKKEVLSNLRSYRYSGVGTVVNAFARASRLRSKTMTTITLKWFAPNRSDFRRILTTDLGLHTCNGRSRRWRDHFSKDTSVPPKIL